MAEGNPAELPPPIGWKDGWMIGEPDLVIDMPGEQEVPASGTLPYKIFSAKVPWHQDALVTAVEILPGNRSVLHHAEVYIDDFVSMVASYAPGSQSLVLPEDTACRFPAGQTLTWLMHYTPNGKAVTDRSKVGFRFWKAKQPPRYLREMSYIQNLNIDIPPGCAAGLAENDWYADGERELISIRPHMHLRGKDFRLDITYPDGRQECLLSVPHYDFNWQITYEFARPPRFPKGTKLHLTSHYDNSASNPANPDPKKHVKWGNQTEDEMQTVLLDCRYAYREPPPPKPSPGKEVDWLTVRVWVEVVGAELLLVAGAGTAYWRLRTRLRRTTVPGQPEPSTSQGSGPTLDPGAALQPPAPESC
jgi:hypothetical protein